MNPAVPDDAEPGTKPTQLQIVQAVNGFAYGCIGADIHIFGSGTPVYLLFEHRDLPPPDTAWLRRQPSRMLDVRAELVDFTGRDAELAELVAWRDSDTHFAAHWLHGEGGQGKTRLAGQLARDARRTGWKVVVAVHGTDTHSPEPGSQDLRLSNRTVGVMLLVDYADRWSVTDLSWLMQNSLLSQPEHKKVRVLLIGRSMNSLPALRRKLHGLHRGVECSDRLLPPLLDDDQARDRMYTTARDCFAHHYPEVIDPSAIAPPQPLGNAGFGLTLAIHMAALVAVDSAARGRTPPADIVGLSAYLLDREYENWRQLYENSDRGLDYHTSDTDMARAVFTAILTGLTDHASAERILARLMPGVNTASVLADHAVCYPPADPAMALEPMVPDRLAEDFLALLVPGHPVTGCPTDAWATGVAATLLTDPDTAGCAPRALTFLASATDRWPHLGTNVLYPLLSARPGVALDGGSVALTAIATIGAHEDDIEPELSSVLKAIESVLPEDSHADLDVGILHVVERLTTRYLAETIDVERRAELYLGLGNRRSNAGEWATALTAHAEATRLYRQLTGDEEHHRTNLAISLNNLADALRHLGRMSEAVAQAREAVAIHREVVENEPRRRDALASSLTGLGVQLIKAGHPAEALRASDEAVRIRRELAATDPVRHGHHLAIALTNLAGLLHDLHRVADAATAAEEAVGWARQLATASPGQYLDLLGTSLNNLAAALLGQGLHERAAATQLEAVEVYRRLATVNPRAHSPHLLLWLTNLGLVLSMVDRASEAIVCLEEAVVLARRLADSGSVPDQRRLAGSLEEMGNVLSRLGRADEALAAYREAADTHMKADRVIHAAEPGQARLTYRLAALYRQAGDRKSEADALLNLCAAGYGWRGHPDFVAAGRRAAALYRELDNRAGEAAALLNLGVHLAEIGHHDDAVAACTRAAEIFHQESDRGAESAALSNLSSALLGAQRYEEAVAASERAIAIQRELDGKPQTGRPLFNLGSALLGTGRVTEAITVLEQAANTYRLVDKGEYEDSGRPWFEADTYFELGRAYAKAGQSADAARACQRAADLFEAAGDLKQCRSALLAACDVLCRSGCYPEAVGVSRRVLATCHSASARPHKAWALAHLGAALLELGDFDDSVEQSRHAVSIFAELADPHEVPGEAMALANLGHALIQVNRTDEAIDLYQLAVEKWRAIGDTAHEHQTSYRLATALLGQRRFTEAIGPYQRCADTAHTLADRAGEARALAGAATVFVELARFEQAIIAGRRSADLFREIGDHRHEAAALGRVRAALVGLGSLDDAAHAARRAVEAAGQAGDSPGVATALRELGELLDQLDRVPEAAEAAKQAATICRGMGDHVAEGRALVDLGSYQLKLRQYAAAIEVSQRAITLGHGTGHRTTDHRATTAAALLNLGPALLATGRFEEASTASQQAVLLIRQLHGPGTDGRTLRALQDQALNTSADALGRLAAACATSGRHENAIDAYRRAASAYQELGAARNEAATLANLGLALIQLKRNKEALAPSRRAAEIFGAIGDHAYEVRALFHVVQALLGLNQPVESLPVIRKTLAICRQIGDHDGERHALLCLGGVLVDTRQLDEAITINHHAAKLLREAGDYEGEAMVLEFLRRAQQR